MLYRSPFKTYLMNNHIPVYRRFPSFAKGKMVIRLIASPSQALSPEISFHMRQYSSVLSALDILAFVSWRLLFLNMLFMCGRTALAPGFLNDLTRMVERDEECRRWRQTR